MASPSSGGDYGNSFIRVWGIPLADIAQAASLSTPFAAPLYNVVFSGGMGKGLPLANPAQAGPIVRGSVFRAVGNWIGTDMTLDLYLAAISSTAAVSAGNASVPALPVNNFSFNWTAGQPLAAAIRSTLQTAYPGMPIQIMINPGLVLDRIEPGIYSTLGEFADFINRRSNAILGPGNPQYQGVQIATRDGGLVVYDGTASPPSGTTASAASTGGAPAPAFKTVNIAFTDLVGQPTWIGANQIQVTCILRADIQVGDSITLPPSQATVTAAAAIQSNPTFFTGPKWSSQFQGTFQVQTVRSVGNYKGESGSAWVTTLNAVTAAGVAVAQ
jgi:hypothetical protein